MDRKKSVDYLINLLRKGGYNCAAIHGDKTQFERNAVMDKFRCGKVPILIATDVIGRGIDFPNVAYIFNYDTPKNIDDYVHRIGRSARCGNKGHSVSFINENSKPIITDLFKLLKKQGKFIPSFLEKMFYEGKGYYNSKYENYSYSNKSTTSSSELKIDENIIDGKMFIKNENEDFKDVESKMSWRK